MATDPTIPMNQRDLVFFDLETSGLDPDMHEIIDLAAVRVKPDFSRQVAFVNRLCRMDHPERAEPKALEVNGYNAAEWKDALPVRVALIEFASILDGDTVLVGHNAARFDWAFIYASTKREKLAVPDVKYVVDTASMAWPLCMRGVVPKIALESICSLYGVSNVGAHRAMSDVRRCMAVYCKLLGLPDPILAVNAGGAR